MLPSYHHFTWMPVFSPHPTHRASSRPPMISRSSGRSRSARFSIAAFPFRHVVTTHPRAGDRPMERPCCQHNVNRRPKPAAIQTLLPRRQTGMNANGRGYPQPSPLTLPYRRSRVRAPSSALRNRCKAWGNPRYRPRPSRFPSRRGWRGLRDCRGMPREPAPGAKRKIAAWSGEPASKGAVSGADGSRARAELHHAARMLLLERSGTVPRALTPL